MIFGNLNTSDNLTIYPEVLQRAIHYLGDHELAEMDEGVYPLDESITLKIQNPILCPREGKYPEVHREYIDIMMVLKGKERLYFFPDTKGNQIHEVIPERDLTFYESSKEVNENTLVLCPNDYVIFFPWDAHIPFCTVSQEENIKKCVLKVKMSALGKLSEKESLK
ncbi:YhcH/YjgK/YiaL family protein [Caproiciproducens faecalis]|uniref:YhcH/YjgK/YiaL family protein n=1 Tax=Caproiciproducens faecalis TaxID=2820301 RepID=A0ABS7DJR6_9FIRM|nr:YhcH/YjgK/YiaL family protein [Caproiciproducens faecalis]MBW7571337.1 YhcH/YjgK/YiaL family protein [Caproiciproducens faecalis]